MIENDILRDAADLFGVTVEAVTSAMLHRQYADARAVVCYVLCSMRGMSTTEVGRMIHRTHATVIYYNRKADDWLRMPKLNRRGACAIRELENRYKDQKL